MDTIESAVSELFAADPQLQRRLQIFISISGISKIMVFTMLIEMPVLGDLEARQAPLWPNLRQ